MGFGVPLRAILWVLVILSSERLAYAQTASAPQKEPHRWNVAYPLVLWLPLYGAEVTLPPSPPCASCPPESASGSGSSTGLSGAYFGSLRTEFGRFEAIAYYNYAGLTAEKTSPFFKAEAKFTFATLIGGIRVFGPVFVEAGARYHALDANFTITTFPTVSWEPSRWAPLIGVRMRHALKDEWRLYAHLDWSGTDEVSATDGDVQIEWRPHKHFSVIGGYGVGHVKWDGTIGGRAINTKQTLHGPIIGVGIPF